MDVVDVLLLQRGEEALHRRVVQAVPAPAHGLLDPVPSQDLAVGLGGVLPGLNRSTTATDATVACRPPHGTSGSLPAATPPPPSPRPRSTEPPRRTRRTAAHRL